MSGCCHDHKKAPRTGAFFIVCRLLVGLLLWSLLQAGPVQPGSFSSADCPVDRIDEQVNVRQVFDGDTVLLTDGRKIRLLGINSPELGRDDRPPEPLAREARLALAALIKQAAAVGLRYESKRQDHYKRELAHLIINGRINAQQYLLQRGLALAIAVPPNLWQQDCYQQAEDQARTHNRGVWAVDYFRALDVGRQAPGRGGFQLVSGNVVDVGKTAQWVWLDLAGGVSLRIARDDWQYFSTQNWRQWRHRDIEARGWLYQYRDRWQLRVRHPQNIKIGLRTKD